MATRVYQGYNHTEDSFDVVDTVPIRKISCKDLQITYRKNWCFNKLFIDGVNSKLALPNFIASICVIC